MVADGDVGELATLQRRESRLYSVASGGKSSTLLSKAFEKKKKNTTKQACFISGWLGSMKGLQRGFPLCAPASTPTVRESGPMGPDPASGCTADVYDS